MQTLNAMTTRIHKAIASAPDMVMVKTEVEEGPDGKRIVVYTRDYDRSEQIFVVHIEEETESEEDEAPATPAAQPVVAAPAATFDPGPPADFKGPESLAPDEPDELVDTDEPEEADADFEFDNSDGAVSNDPGDSDGGSDD